MVYEGIDINLYESERTFLLSDQLVFRNRTLSRILIVGMEEEEGEKGEEEEVKRQHIKT